ncbi:hypothetical protein CYMTET_17937 [Cymbomonas tetramitiformis]|uniref:Uncharacterized protein n=1 Tax=Cymbomonas tetramitiformis TaxID=36881 RepID=A0AAE0G9N8_9CHLO|nr:hypothetical protein CYMTET_17937 [Cymbomonas tetramitiformis]
MSFLHIEDDKTANSGLQNKACSITAEAQEAHLVQRYEVALSSLRNGHKAAAKGLLREILDNDYLIANVKGATSVSGAASSLLQIKFLTHKNLARILELEEDRSAVEEALREYADACAIDGSDVVMWHRMAMTAASLGKPPTHCSACPVLCSSTILLPYDVRVVCIRYIGRIISKGVKWKALDGTDVLHLCALWMHLRPPSLFTLWIHLRPPSLFTLWIHLRPPSLFTLLKTLVTSVGLLAGGGAGRMSVARVALEYGLRHSPQHPLLITELLEVLLELHDLPAALAFAEYRLELDPLDARARGAQAALQRELDPHSAGIYEMQAVPSPLAPRLRLRRTFAPLPKLSPTAGYETLQLRELSWGGVAEALADSLQDSPEVPGAQGGCARLGPRELGVRPCVKFESLSPGAQAPGEHGGVPEAAGAEAILAGEARCSAGTAEESSKDRPTLNAPAEPAVKPAKPEGEGKDAEPAWETRQVETTPAPSAGEAAAAAEVDVMEITVEVDTGKHAASQQGGGGGGHEARKKDDSIATRRSRRQEAKKQVERESERDNDAVACAQPAARSCLKEEELQQELCTFLKSLGPEEVGAPAGSALLVPPAALPPSDVGKSKSRRVSVAPAPCEEDVSAFLNQCKANSGAVDLGVRLLEHLAANAAATALDPTASGWLPQKARQWVLRLERALLKHLAAAGSSVLGSLSYLGCLFLSELHLMDAGAATANSLPNLKRCSAYLEAASQRCLEPEAEPPSARLVGGPAEEAELQRSLRARHHWLCGLVEAAGRRPGYAQHLELCRRLCAGEAAARPEDVLDSGRTDTLRDGAAEVGEGDMRVVLHHLELEDGAPVEVSARAVQEKLVQLRICAVVARAKRLDERRRHLLRQRRQQAGPGGGEEGPLGGTEAAEDAEGMRQECEEVLGELCACGLLEAERAAAEAHLKEEGGEGRGASGTGMCRVHCLTSDEKWEALLLARGLARVAGPAHIGTELTLHSRLLEAQLEWWAAGRRARGEAVEHTLAEAARCVEAAADHREEGGVQGAAGEVRGMLKAAADFFQAAYRKLTVGLYGLDADGKQGEKEGLGGERASKRKRAMDSDDTPQLKQQLLAAAGLMITAVTFGDGARALPQLEETVSLIHWLHTRTAECQCCCGSFKARGSNGNAEARSFLDLCIARLNACKARAACCAMPAAVTLPPAAAPPQDAEMPDAAANDTGSSLLSAAHAGLERSVRGSPEAAPKKLPPKHQELKGQAEAALMQCFYCLYGVEMSAEELDKTHVGAGSYDLKDKDACVYLWRCMPAVISELEVRKGREKGKAEGLIKVLKATYAHFDGVPAAVMRGNPVISAFLVPAKEEERLSLTDEVASMQSAFANLSQQPLHLLNPDIHNKLYLLMSRYLESQPPAAKESDAEQLRSTLHGLHNATKGTPDFPQAAEIQALVWSLSCDAATPGHARLVHVHADDDSSSHTRWYNLATSIDEVKDITMNDVSALVAPSRWGAEGSVEARVDFDHLIALNRQRVTRAYICAYLLTADASEKASIMRNIGVSLYEGLQDVPPVYDQRCRRPDRTSPQWQHASRLARGAFEEAVRQDPEHWKAYMYQASAPSCSMLSGSPVVGAPCDQPSTSWSVPLIGPGWPVQCVPRGARDEM